jgi:hypothetical protein
VEKGAGLKCLERERREIGQRHKQTIWRYPALLDILNCQKAGIKRKRERTWRDWEPKDKEGFFFIKPYERENIEIGFL